MMLVLVCVCAKNLAPGPLAIISLRFFIDHPTRCAWRDAPRRATAHARDPTVPATAGAPPTPRLHDTHHRPDRTHTPTRPAHNTTPQTTSPTTSPSRPHRHHIITNHIITNACCCTHRLPDLHDRITSRVPSPTSSRRPSSSSSPASSRPPAPLCSPWSRRPWSRR